MSANAFRQLTDEALETAFSDPLARLSVLSQLQVWRAVDEQVQQIEKWVAKFAGHNAERKALRSVAGICAILSLTIALETGAISRFASVGDYASYCRMVKSERLSNGKKKGEGNRKCGNRYLAWAYIEAATFALSHSAPIKAWYVRKCRKRHKILAIKAVAHKLARACYCLMRDGGVFDVTRAFG